MLQRLKVETEFFLKMPKIITSARQQTRAHALTRARLQASRAEIIETTIERIGACVCVCVVIWIRSIGGRLYNNDQFNGKVFFFCAVGGMCVCVSLRLYHTKGMPAWCHYFSLQQHALQYVFSHYVCYNHLLYLYVRVVCVCVHPGFRDESSPAHAGPPPVFFAIQTILS